MAYLNVARTPARPGLAVGCGVGAVAAVAAAAALLRVRWRAYNV